MASGFPVRYVQDLPLDTLDKDHFLVLAKESALKLKWKISFVNENGFIAYTKISWSSWGEKVTINIENGVVILESECTGSQIVDWGKNKKNIKMLLEKFEELKTHLTPSEIETKLFELNQSYQSTEDDILKKPYSTSNNKISDFFSVFKPKEGYFISPILVNLNLFIFAIMVISGVHILLPESEDLIKWGANFKPITLDRQWWRLITSCFLHIGILHLLLNMYALVYIGLLLEPYLGKTRFLSAYLISGIAASLTSLWWHDLTISAGASGAIFGMYGVFIALLTTNLIDKSVRKSLLTSIAVFIFFNILNGLKPNSGIDNAAHLGGLISGLLIGYAFVPSLKHFKNKTIKFSTIGVLSMIILISSIVVYKSLPKDSKYKSLTYDYSFYEKEMNRFVSMEAMALEVYKLPLGTPNEKILSEIKDRGLYYWKENIKLIDSFKYLDLPLPIKARNEKLRQYCELRIKSYELIYKTVNENTQKYQTEIIELNKKIEAIILELSQKNRRK